MLGRSIRGQRRCRHPMSRLRRSDARGLSQHDRASLLSSTDLQQAVAYRDFCDTAPNLRNGYALVDDVWFESAPYPGPGGQLSASRHR